jgi:hypothetical protein
VFAGVKLDKDRRVLVETLDEGNFQLEIHGTIRGKYVLKSLINLEEGNLTLRGPMGISI